MNWQKEKRLKAERAGRWAEYLAVLWLTCRGYRILKLRYKTPVGEIDLIAKKKMMIIFIEVKWRKSHVQLEEIISHKNKQRMARAARYWLSRNSKFISFQMRFDAILMSRHQWPKHIENIIVSN